MCPIEEALKSVISQISKLYTLLFTLLFFDKQHIIDPSDLTQGIVIVLIFIFNKSERGDTPEVGLLEEKIHGSKVNHQVTAEGGQVANIG
jgi:hypothetical protein